MGYSYDIHPHVGEVPGKPNELVVAGFNGHGMPVIWLAAKGIAEMIRTGKKFEEVGLPKMFKTAQERIDKTAAGDAGSDILN
jgi:glycine/D-amino acid oxidase-like deaminating enzyme